MRPRRVSSLGFLALLAFAGNSEFAQADTLSKLSPKLRRLEIERHKLELALSALPPAPIPQHTERLGYHSGYSTSPETVEWIEMDLCREEALDAIVLVPAASNGSGGLLAGYGFPVRFRVEVSDSSDHAGRVVVADNTHADFPNPGALPVFLPCGGAHARFVRITATRLFREGDRALFALGEVMLLQGQRNLAGRLRRSDFTCSRTMGALPVWGLSNLVDGHSVLGPPEGRQNSPTLGYRSRTVRQINETQQGLPRWVQVDLGASFPIDEVRLFPAHPPEFAHRPGYGWAPSLKVDLSEDSEFHNAVQIVEFNDGASATQRDPVSPGDNPIAYIVGNESARYVRVSAKRLFNANGGFVLALAEMQVWSGNSNVALGKAVTAFDDAEETGWSRTALVDGFTSRANIVDWPEWLAGLSERRETVQRLALLETDREAIVASLERTIWWILGLLLGATVISLLIMNFRQRHQRRMEMDALRQRISEDLHDEIGSSLGSITFISDDALALTNNDALRSELSAIRNTAQQALDSMRDLVRLAQSGTYGQGDLTEHLRQIAERTLRGIPHTFDDQAATAFNRLPMQQRRDLVLMFKETLHNLVRHAEATQADIALAQYNGSLNLTVRDNGCGFEPGIQAANHMGLNNLKRRAAKHGGEVRILSAPTQGTTLVITLPIHV